MAEMSPPLVPEPLERSVVGEKPNIELRMKNGPEERPQMINSRLELVSRPLDPPPFFLEGEIRVEGTGFGLSALALGVLMVVSYPVLFGGADQPLPSLSLLVVVALVAASFYFGVRFLAYWGTWLRAIGRHSYNGGIHPAARGELPRNAFLVVLFAPLASFMVVGLVIWRLGLGVRPEFWLAAAMAVSISLRDLKAAWHVMRLDPECWIKETRHGIDVLRPVDRAWWS